jgi:hypothetical protein
MTAKEKARAKGHEYLMNVITDCPNVTNNEAVDIAKYFVNEIIFLTTDKEKREFYEEVYCQLEYYYTKEF